MVLREKKTQQAEAAMQINGKTIVVTGATSGLGQAAAIDFAHQGAHVIIVGRDAHRAEETRVLATQTGGKADVVLGDVSTVGGARALAAAILAKTSRVDVLLNNAGGTFKSRMLTRDGIEMSFALNTLGAFVLETELHGALAAAGGRAVNVATGFLDRFPLDVNDIAAPHAYKGMAQYGRAKLASVMMTVEQAHRLEGVKFVSVHPGIIMGTRFGGGQPRAMQLLMGPVLRVMGLACTLDEAVRRFAVACFGDVSNGSYLVKGKEAPLPKQANQAPVRDGIWQLLERASHREQARAA